MIASLPYSPPVNTDIDYYRTFFGLFCKCCNVSCAIFVRRREASACLIMLSTKPSKVATGAIFNAFGMARPGFEPTTSRSRSGCSTTEPQGP